MNGLVFKVNVECLFSGMQNEGIYRLSGNKNDIETVMEKFEASKWCAINSSYLIKVSCYPTSKSSQVYDVGIMIPVNY